MDSPKLRPETYAFWSEEPNTASDPELEDDRKQEPEHSSRLTMKAEEQTVTYARESIYIRAFEEVVATVLNFESHLFSDYELEVLKHYAELSYHARYLLVRLCLRKQETWFRLSSLKYEREMGTTKAIITAIDELCGKPKSETQVSDEAMEEEYEAGGKEDPIDLTNDPEDNECVMHPPSLLSIPLALQAPTAGPSSIPASSSTFTMQTDPEEGQPALVPFTSDDSEMQLDDLLQLLSLEELKHLAKDLKVPHNGKRRDLLMDILKISSSQNMLNFTPLANQGKGKAGDMASISTLKQATLSFPVTFRKGKEKENSHLSTSSALRRPPTLRRANTLQERVRQLVMKSLNRCVLVNPGIYALFRRIDLIYFRSTEHPTDSLVLPTLLSFFKKRHYNKVSWSRTPDIWHSRVQVCAYSDALAAEARIAGIMDGGKVPSRNARTTSASATPITVDLKPTGDDSAEDTQEVKAALSEEVEETVAEKKAKQVRRLFEEIYFPKWQELVREKDEEADHERAIKSEALVEDELREPVLGLIRAKRAGLERFECGYIYTRIVQKCADALAILKDSDRELEVIEYLLKQPYWRKGKRGRWHERRALLLNKRVGKGKRPPQEPVKAAITAVNEALADVHTRMRYRPKLVRRLVVLEKKLVVQPEERTQFTTELLESEKITICGYRIWEPKQTTSSTSLVDTQQLRFSTPARTAKDAKAWGGLTPMSTQTMSTLTKKRRPPKSVKIQVPNTQERWKGKSIWRGKRGEKVDVETFALQHYEDRGFKGFHSEGSIVRTLFAFLFYDIIFAPVPGAFETQYQTSPLDMAEEAFYHARKHLIEDRLADLRQGKALDIVKRVDKEHRENATWCIGLRWDLCSRDDLLEIVECFEGDSLAQMCLAICEDYAGRGGGVPDLFIWDAERKLCKFVEVKGPGDSLAENQKLWIDIMLRSRIQVEVCRVEEVGKAQGSKKKASKRTPIKADIESEDKMDATPGPRNSLPRGVKRQHDDSLPTVKSETLPSTPKRRKGS